MPDARTSQQILQLVGAGKCSDASHLLERMLLSAQNREMPAETLLQFFKTLLDGLRKAYAPMTPVMAELRELDEMLCFESAYDYYLALRAWMGRLSAYIAEDLESQNMRKMRIAITYIRDNYRSAINMAMASNQVSMNYSQFSHLFKQHTGCSFRDYLKNIRIEESKRLLGDPSLSIHSVSALSGFKNEKHFMRSFKEEVGVSPSDYRRNLLRV
jgi:two-component system response regulator YesN